MNTDSHFVIGRSHETAGQSCQDYALAGALPLGGGFAAVSDGCSSGGRTDLGARILCLALERCLRRSSHPAPQLIRQAQARALRISPAILGSRPDDLLATSLYAYVGPDARFVQVDGDGVVAWATTDGTMTMVRFEWADNTPAYPAYGRDRYRSFNARHGGDTKAIKLTGEVWTRREGTEPVRAAPWPYPLATAATGVTLLLPPTLAAVGVFTDGATQIDGMPWTQAVTELMAFKSGNGAFLKRRLLRFLKTAAAQGCIVHDDLACAAILLKEEVTPCP